MSPRNCYVLIALKIARATDPVSDLPNSMGAEPYALLGERYTPEQVHNKARCDADGWRRSN